VKEQTIRLLVELIGATAVLLGLIFVGLELRQNTAAVQASTLQGIVDMGNNYLIETSLDPEFIPLLNKAQAHPDQLDEVEALRIQRVLRSQWQRYQSAFQHWRNGTLSNSGWETYSIFICNGVRNVGSGSFQSVQAKFWEFERAALIDDFVSYVESCRPDLAEVANH
jgi:hypothetical protein